MSLLSSLSRALYKGSQISSDANTLARKGPGALVRKRLNRSYHRSVFRVLRKAGRGWKPFG